MSTARTHYKAIAPPAVNNRPTLAIPIIPDAFELEPPTTRPDEISLTKALQIISSPTSPPALKDLLTAAVAKEITKVTAIYDTLRPISSANPMEENAIRLSSLMFIKFKRDQRVTARLAGCGCDQPVDSYDNISASTSDHQTFALTVAAYYADAVHNNTLSSLTHSDFDVPGAFLNCRLPRSATGGRQVVIKMPHNLPHPLAGKWMEVVGALYGIKQSNHIFELDFAATMAAANFYPPTMRDLPDSTPLDTSTYHYTNPADPSKKCTVIMHVDDGDLLATDPTIAANLKSTLEARYGPLTWNDTSSSFTGTHITRHPSGAVSLDLTDHIIKMLHKSGMDNVPGALTPSNPDLFLPSKDTTPTNKVQYQRIVGDLTHISRVRHDIAKETQHHSRQTQSPTKGDLFKVIRTLRYLKAFPSTAATYYTTEGPILVGHVDASHANHPDGTSTTGLTLTIGSTSAPFYSKSFPQDEVALDPCTAEYYGLTPISRLLLRYRYFLDAIGFPQTAPTPIYVDNLPAIKLALSSTIPRKSRYIHARHHFIRQCIASNLIILRQRNTNNHPPDLHTKSLGPTSHHYLTKLIMNTDAPTSCR